MNIISNSMFVFKHGPRRLCSSIYLQSTSTTTSISRSRSYASRIEVPFAPPPFHIVDTCPAPTCPCRETPTGLDIDREKSLNGTMPAYVEQVLICTGKQDWMSRIEDEDDGVLVRGLKSLLGPKGRFNDPYHNVLVTNTSFAPTSAPPSPPPSATPLASAYLVPSFTCIPHIPTDRTSLEAFAQAFLLPSRLHQAHDKLSRAEQDILLRQSAQRSAFPSARPLDEILILICGHGGRDSRCGTLGPILAAEFEAQLQRQKIVSLHAEPEVVAEARPVPAARVGLCSHIGGHKFAGNVIVAIPPSFKQNALAGKSIWYGRVGPEQVEGIVQKTVLEGKVIRELFRGGVDQKEGMMRL